MSEIKEIQDEIYITNNFKNLVDIYGEIASIRMMKIRTNVLNNRNYIFSITQIFFDTLAAFLKKASRATLNEKLFKKNRITFLSHNGKTVFVLISSNTLINFPASSKLIAPYSIPSSLNGSYDIPA